MPYKLLGFHLTYNKAGIDTLSKYYRIFNKIIPTLLSVRSDGSLQINKSDSFISTYLDKDKIIPLVQNMNLDSSISNQLINNDKAVDKFVVNLISYLDNTGYKELCLDIEGVKYKNKRKYIEFINKLSDILHEAGYYLSVAIPAKSENNQDSTWSGAYDYNLLGQIVDKVIIMTYDFHWPGGPPGPIAPLSWLQDVIDYAIIEIPLEKLYFGLGLYGYDWIINGEEPARGLVYKQIKDLVTKFNVRVEWDQDSFSPYLRYKNNGLEHEVWFENKRSIEKKLKLISEFHLEGVAFWRLGQEDPAIWSLIGRQDVP